MEEKKQEVKQDQVDRRSFMRQAAAVVAGASAVPAVAKADVFKSILPAAVLGANEKIRTGHIGTGGMGRSHLRFMLRRTTEQQKTDVVPAALCDSYKANLERGAQMVASVFPQVTQHKDFREIIDNKDIDAVVIATPDHWHCLPVLYAADAKKAIYCEKPLSTTIAEGLAMVESVRRNKVIFQGGTMQRSGEHFQEAMKLVQDGYIGDVHRIETFNHEPTDLKGIEMGEDDEAKYVAKGLDWNWHQGWVEHKPFNTNRFIYNFRWFLDYSGGKITDWGAHLVDIALATMGEDKQPKSVVATGNKFCMQDNRTTPDTLEVLWEYDNYILSFSNRVYNGYLPQGYSDHGIIYHGTKGTLRLDRGGYEVYKVPNNGGCEPKKTAGPTDADTFHFRHWENFAECIRSRKDPIVTVEKLNNTTKTCHMGTCSYVAGGAKLHWDAEKNQFKGDSEEVKKANQWAYREYQNGWSLKAPYKA